MSNSVNVFRTEPELWLLTDDGQKIPVTYVEMSFSVNTIPICNCSVVAGKNLSENENNIDFRSFLSEESKVSVVSRFKGQAALDKDWPGTEVVIFEGDILSIVESVTSDTFALNIQIQHWLSRLQYAYIPNAINSVYAAGKFFNFLSPKTPTSNTKPSVLNDINIQNPLIDAFKTNGKNVWKNLIRATFLTIAEQIDNVPRSNLNECQIIRIPSADLGSTLNRIEELEDDLNISLIDPIVYGAYKDHFLALPLSGQLTSSLWEVLVGYVLPEFNLQIIPQVGKAVVAPICPTLRTQKDKTNIIKREEIYSINYYETIIKPIGGVLVASYYDNVTKTDATGFTSLEACYISESYRINKTGSVYVVDPPSWIINTKLRIQRPITLVSGLISADASLDGGDVDQPSITDYLNNYAQTIYTQKRLEERSLSVVSRLRFDVAPGSIIEIQSPNNANVTSVGRVRTVTVQISTTKESAVTVFDVDHVKPALAEVNTDFVVEKPPLYNKGFYGAPLVEEFKDL
jgi:hypothetical protein